MPQVLLAPFHAHRDESRRELSGLSFVLGLQTAGKLLGRTLVAMPVSKMGRAAAVLELRELDGATGDAAELARRALVVHENELGDPSLAARLRASLRALH